MVVGFEDFVAGEEVGEQGEGGVAGVGFEDVGDEEVVEVVEEGGVDLGTADDEDVGVLEVKVLEIGGVVDDGDAFGRPLAIAGEDDVLALGEGATDGFVGLAAHDDGVAAGGAFEEGEILGEVPGEVAASADDAVGGHGDDAGEVEGICYLVIELLVIGEITRRRRP